VIYLVVVVMIKVGLMIKNIEEMKKTLKFNENKKYTKLKIKKGFKI
jgi:hypothetical protein